MLSNLIGGVLVDGDGWLVGGECFVVGSMPRRTAVTASKTMAAATVRASAVVMSGRFFSAAAGPKNLLIPSLRAVANAGLDAADDRPVLPRPGDPNTGSGGGSGGDAS
jgi:hypothetical protein